MALISKPVNLSLTWASGGDILDPGNSKYATGWQVEIPPRQWFNYLDNRQDTAIAHINQFGVALWDATTEYQYNASGVKSLTMGSNGIIYRTLTTNTNQNPTTTVGVHWEIAFADSGAFYTKTESDATFLAKAQNLADLTNTVTARTNLSVYSQAQTYTRDEVDTRTTKATQVQAEAGASDAVLMTPLRTEQWGNQHVIGMNQTWQNVTGSRALDTTYTNSTGRPIMVSFFTDSADGSGARLDVNGVTVARSAVVTGPDGGFICLIPAGATYLIGNVAVSSFTWVELR